jgi:hypothetical protein
LLRNSMMCNRRLRPPSLHLFLANRSLVIALTKSKAQAAYRMICSANFTKQLSALLI